MNTLPAFPASDRYSAREFETTVRRYLDGASCARAVIGTAVNPEVLRAYLKRAGLIRSMSASQRMKSLSKRRRAERMFDADRASIHVARELAIDRSTVYAWRRQHRAGLGVLEWSSGKRR